MTTIYLVIHHDAHGENANPVRAFEHREGAEAFKGARALVQEIGDDSYDSILPLPLSPATTIADLLQELRA